MVTNYSSSRLLMRRVSRVLAFLKGTHSPTNMPSLDVMVSIKDGFIETDFYTKPTDKHQ